MDTNGQQYNTTIYNINFELGHTTLMKKQLAVQSKLGTHEL
jgi:hypothetical protein